MTEPEFDALRAKGAEAFHWQVGIVDDDGTIDAPQPCGHCGWTGPSVIEGSFLTDTPA